ncbi:Nicotinate-nucleotide adenylyltransferase [Lysobacter dokdonensis DS-58]|uniref:Probable nicotinate-nucleotide adenylyltransferase n=1 Tax=Lysobacter dokdonensis DS-58 TaxID=1300345 RepID=A0A0A2WLP7_9GAMM|nr:nicotinate-nucleotide adenylyltransferase [Lysobacter dokdonensis]KGQ20718.1 Nicotinate-nucleotide adenylyltransferase [Lysobacter dokdonensis DS-58]
MTPLVLCFGGTFDPVHTGHLAIARAVRDALHADVHLLPSADPPHKGPTHASAEQRARMLDLAVEGEHGLIVDRRELRRAGPSYTVDTLRELRAEYGPHAPLVWMVGGDSVFGLDSWHRWRELFELGHLLAIDRPGSPIDPDALKARAPEVHAELEPRWCRPAQLHALPAGGFAEFPLGEERPESSTALRRRIADQAPGWRDWLPAPVADLIAASGLYGRPVP